MLRYHTLPHDLPKWEEGSKDVVKRKGIKNASHYKDLDDNCINEKIVFNEFSEMIERAGYSQHLYRLL